MESDTIDFPEQGLNLLAEKPEKINSALLERYADRKIWN